MVRKVHFHRRRVGQKIRTKLEDIVEVLEKLRNELSSSNVVVVVEGVSDVKALQSLGITGRILPLSSLRRLRIKPDTRLILLLDFDYEGREMTKKIHTRLVENKVSVDLFYYRRLSEARHLGINTIEELGRYLSKRSIQLGFDY